MARKRKQATDEDSRAQNTPEDEAVVVEVLPGDEREDSEALDEDAEVVEDAQAAEEEVLADTSPATDAELDAIERDLTSGQARAAPEGSTALARRDPLGAYMAEVRRYPLLTREQEHELAVRWVEEGDLEAAKLLMSSNLRLVVKIAHEYRRAYQSLLDLVQEGNVGLVRAVQKFDPYRGVKLSTYAGWWIKAYILKYILNNWRMVKVGTTQNQRKLFFNLRKQRAALQAAGIEPTAERIAKALDVPTKEVVDMQRRLQAPDMSLDAPLAGEEGDGARTRMDLLEGEHGDPEGDVENEEFKRLLQSKLQAFGATLDGRELEIFTNRLMSDEPVTLQELGDRWGVSRERARQVEKRLVLRLREYLQEQLGDAVEIALGHE